MCVYVRIFRGEVVYIRTRVRVCRREHYVTNSRTRYYSLSRCKFKSEKNTDTLINVQ